jgi:hypothetical protein
MHARFGRIRMAYATALWAGLILALLDGGMAALVGDLPVTRPYELARFALFTAGSYALLAVVLATLEIPFVMLLGDDAEKERSSRAAKGYAAGVAAALALFPLEPLAVALGRKFARTEFAGLALTLAGVGLALAALFAFALLERLFARALRRVEGGATGRALASLTAAVLMPVVVIGAWGVLIAGEILEPGSREAVTLAATAVALLAIQGGIAWLMLARSERFAGWAVGGALASILALASLVDGAGYALDDDPALEAVSHQTLLGSFVLPTLRQAVQGPHRGPAILPLSPAKKRVAPRSYNPGPAAVPSARAAAGGISGGAAPSPAGRSPHRRAPGRNLLLVTFDAFAPSAMGYPESTALQELAARSFQAPLRAPADVPGALRDLLEDGEPLAAWLSAAGYDTAGFQAWTAKGRGEVAPRGFARLRLVGGSEVRHAADEAVARARAFLRGAGARPWCVWLHLPGPWGRGDAKRRAASRRAGTRLGGLLREVERLGASERTVIAVVGLPGRAGEPGAALLAAPGVSPRRGEALGLRDFRAHLEAALGGR